MKGVVWVVDWVLGNCEIVWGICWNIVDFGWWKNIGIFYVDGNCMESYFWDLVVVIGEFENEMVGSDVLYMIEGCLCMNIVCLLVEIGGNVLCYCYGWSGSKWCIWWIKVGCGSEICVEF